jgi:hypothetical protein
MNHYNSSYVFDARSLVGTFTSRFVLQLIEIKLFRDTSDFCLGDLSIELVEVGVADHFVDDNFVLRGAAHSLLKNLIMNKIYLTHSYELSPSSKCFEAMFLGSSTD